MAHHIPTIRTYLIVFATLMILLLLTVLAGHLHMGRFNHAVALTIAVGKAVVVLLYFMHLRWSSKQTWIFASAAFFWFGILMTLTFSDYLTRGNRPTQSIISPAVVPQGQQSEAVSQSKTP
ncbi:MAG TPA: cytochrome C oxidase subunit IV family protein [Tepidisphaeraceae bacterium]